VGGTGTDSNFGIFLQGGEIETAAADVNLTGTAGNGSTDWNRGILLNNAATIISTGTGANAGDIMLDGTGGGGTSTNYGVSIDQAGTLIKRGGRRYFDHGRGRRYHLVERGNRDHRRRADRHYRYRRQRREYRTEWHRGGRDERQ